MYIIYTRVSGVIKSCIAALTYKYESKYSFKRSAHEDL